MLTLWVSKLSAVADACQIALGQYIHGSGRMIASGGCELNLTETHYSTTECEALAVVDGIKHHQPYLSNSKVYGLSDCSSLACLMNVKDPTGRLA